MPDHTSAHLWDLRAQGEAFLRALSRTHQALERYREGHPTAMTDLRAEMRAVLRLIEDLSAAAREANAHLADLPERYVREQRAR